MSPCMHVLASAQDALQHCRLQCCKVSSRQLSHRQCQTSADVLKEAISSTSKQKNCTLHYDRCNSIEGHSEWATGATECLNRRHQQWLPVRDAAPEKMNNKMSCQLCHAAGCRGQKLLQDWSSFVPGKALDFSKTVSDCHRIKSCIAANKECGIKTLRVTLPVFYPASLGPRIWRQVRAQYWSNPQISCSEEALQKDLGETRYAIFSCIQSVLVHFEPWLIIKVKESMEN